MNENIEPINIDDNFLDENGNILEPEISEVGVRHVSKPKSKKQWYKTTSARDYITGNSDDVLSGQGARSLDRAARDYQYLSEDFSRHVYSPKFMARKYDRFGGIDLDLINLTRENAEKEYDSARAKFESGEISEREFSKITEKYQRTLNNLNENYKSLYEVWHGKNSIPLVRTQTSVSSLPFMLGTVGLSAGIIGGIKSLPFIGSAGSWLANLSRTGIQNKFAKDILVGSTVGMTGDQLVREFTPYNGIADGMLRSIFGEDIQQNPYYDYMLFGAEFANPVNLIAPWSVANKTNLYRQFDNFGNMLTPDGRIDAAAKTNTIFTKNVPPGTAKRLLLTNRWADNVYDQTYNTAYGRALDVRKIKVDGKPAKIRKIVKIDRPITKGLYQSIKNNDDLTVIAAGQGKDVRMNYLPSGTPSNKGYKEASEVLSSRLNVLRNKSELTDLEREQLQYLSNPDNMLYMQDYISRLDPKSRRTLLHYVRKGTYNFGKDNLIFESALKVANSNKIDPISFSSPQDILDQYPTSHPQLEGIKAEDMLSYTKVENRGPVEIYKVKNNRGGQLDTRFLMDNHHGYDKNPWCLIARHKVEGMTDLESAYDMWKHYNGHQKQAAILDGKIIGFNADNARKPMWWDMEDMPHKENINMGTTTTNDGNYEIRIGKFITPKMGVKTKTMSKTAHDNSYRFYHSWGDPHMEVRTSHTSYNRTPDGSYIKGHLDDGRIYSAIYDKRGRIESETFESPNGSSETYESKFGRRKLTSQTVIEGTDEITYDGNKRISYVNGKNFSIDFGKEIYVYSKDDNKGFIVKRGKLYDVRENPLDISELPEHIREALTKYKVKLKN